jgi:endogenous inhibitor of DNA gyrase (YacG/DUF329 family)
MSQQKTPDGTKQARCPRCRKEFVYHSIAQHKSFPFCSQRCRDVDLGNWLTGNYVIPGAPLPPSNDDEQEDAT